MCLCWPVEVSVSVLELKCVLNSVLCLQISDENIVKIPRVIVYLLGISKVMLNWQFFQWSLVWLCYILNLFLNPGWVCSFEPLLRSYSQWQVVTTLALLQGTSAVSNDCCCCKYLLRSDLNTLLLQTCKPAPRLLLFKMTEIQQCEINLLSCVLISNTDSFTTVLPNNTVSTESCQLGFQPNGDYGVGEGAVTVQPFVTEDQRASEQTLILCSLLVYSEPPVSEGLMSFF